MRPAAIAFDLAAFECERDLVAAGITWHDLEPGAEQLVERTWIS
jgi:hypothetical protein